MGLQCMLIHGLAGTPFEMEGIALSLEQAGFSVHMLTLPGHATSEEDFKRVSYAEWRTHVFSEYAKLAVRGPVMAVGFSLGGILALDLAENVPLAGLATLAAPLYLYCWHPFFILDWRLPFVGMAHRVCSVVRQKKRDAEAASIAPWRGYDGIVVLRHVADMIRAQKRIRGALAKITAPTLLWQAKGDATCRAWNALYIATHLGSADVTLRMVDIKEKRAGHHLLPTHVETRKAVADSVCSFALQLQ